MSYRGGCAKGMPMAGACRASCGHRALVQEFRDWRHSWEERREDTYHHQLEDDDYAQLYPAPTFRDWLVARAGISREPEPHA